MSGVKSKTLSIGDYNRLVNNANKALEAERRARTAEQRAKAEKDRNDKLAADIRAQDRYHGQLATRIDSMSSQLASAQKTASDTQQKLIQTVNSTNAALKQQQDNFTRALNNTRNDFANAMDKNNKAIADVINKNNTAIKNEINALKAETDQKIDDLKKQVGNPDTVLEDSADNIQVAKQLVDSVKELRDEMLLPGRKTAVISSISTAESALEAAKQNPAKASAALIRAQDAFKDAHDFYRDLIAAENEWASKLSATLQALSAAEDGIKENEKIRVEGLVDKNGNPLPASVFETDHWSDGGLSELKDTVSSLKGTLNSEGAKNITPDELDDIVSQAQLIADEAHSIMCDSFCAVTISSERNKTIKKIGEALAEKCALTTRIQAGYEGSDQRAASIMHLKNDATGFEACIILSTEFENGNHSVKADTTIINPGNNKDAAENFEEALSEIMQAHGFNSQGAPIQVNKEKAKEVENWRTKDKSKVKTVQTISASDKAKNTCVGKNANKTQTN